MCSYSSSREAGVERLNCAVPQRHETADCRSPCFWEEPGAGEAARRPQSWHYFPEKTSHLDGKLYQSVTTDAVGGTMQFGESTENSTLKTENYLYCDSLNQPFTMDSHAIFTSSANFLAWRWRCHRGEMPPADQPQPGAGELAPVIERLSRELQTAYKKLRSTGGLRDLVNLVVQSRLFLTK